MTTIELNEIATDTPNERSDAERLKFKLEMALLMLACGRDDEAQSLMQQAFELLDEMIALGQ